MPAPDGPHLHEPGDEPDGRSSRAHGFGAAYGTGAEADLGATSDADVRAGTASRRSALRRAFAERHGIAPEFADAFFAMSAHARTESGPERWRWRWDPATGVPWFVASTAPDRDAAAGFRRGPKANSDDNGPGAR